MFSLKILYFYLFFLEHSTDSNNHYYNIFVFSFFYGTAFNLCLVVLKYTT